MIQNAGIDGVRVICVGTLLEIQQKNIQLKDGLKLFIWSEDEDENGKSDNLLVESLVKYSDVDKCWVAMFDDKDLKNESQL